MKLEREEDSFIYDISNNGYDVEKINFEIMFPEEIEGKRVRFGLNSKDFKDTLDGLTYEIKYGYLLSGTYNKKLNANDRLRIMIGEPNIKEFNNLLIYIPIGVVVILLLYVIGRLINRKVYR